MDKQVNVKITANTSKFKKAISDATKSLDKMKKSGEKVGKTKIDKNLNKQFKNISKESKKTDKQFKQNTKNLKKLNKTKLNNINKQFSNTSKSSKNFDKQLHQNSKNLKDLNKTKLSGITKQFTNMDKTVSNNKKTLGALQKELNNLKPKSIDSINKSLITTSSGASTASKSFTSVKNELNNLSNRNIETLNRSISTLSGKCPTVSKGINNIKNNVDKVNGNKFSTLSSKLDGVKTKASDAGNKFRDLKSRISDADRQSLQKLTDSTAKLNEEGTRSGNVFSNFDNKIKSLTSGAIGGLSSKIGLVVSSTGRMGSTFVTTAAQVALVTTATKTLTGSEREFTREELKMIASIRMSKETIEVHQNVIKKTEQEIKKLSDSEKTNGVITKENAQKMQAFQEQINKLNDKIKAEEENIKKQTQAFRNSTQATKENAKAEDTLKNSTEKASNSAKKLVSGTQTLRSATGNLKEELKNAAKYTKNLSDEQKKAEKTTKSFGDKMKDLWSKLEGFSTKIGKVVDKTKKDVIGKLNEGDFGGAFSGLKEVGKDVFAAVPGWAKAIVVLCVALKKLYDLGKQRFFDGLNNIKDTLQPVVNGLTNLANGMKTAFTELTGFQFRLSSIITVGANFENQMKKVSVIAKSVGDEEQQLTAKARELGASTRYSASQVGEAFEYMAMAGWSTDEMLKGVQSTLDLATIGATDLGTASDILTDDLTALGLQANQASDFADKLAATITSANTDVVGFGESMKQVGSLAGALGINMTDLATSIGLMANAGIKGSKAGMSLKNLLANMASPTKAQAKALKNLNVAYDEENGYVKTTKEGNIDLEKTIKSLKKSLEGKTRAEKASAVATIAGKNALPGVMALLNATEEEYDELSDKIDNSTSTVHMFNQNMHDVGEVGSDAQKRIEHMKKVFDKTEISATSLGLSSKELGYTISLLGNDSKVSAGNVEQLLDVIESMDNATGDVDKFWRTVGNAKNVKIDGKSINQMIDYNKTLQAIDDSTIGLSDHTIKYAKAHGESVLMTKEYVKNKVKECKTIEEANQFLKEYGLTEDKKNQLLTAKAMSFKDLSYADKIDYLRQTFKGCTKEQIKNKLASEGLAKSYNEVYEIAHMSNKEYKKYKKNLDIIEGASRRMAETMDETTVAAFYGLASAMEDSLIALFDKMKPAIMNATDALTDFFATWRNGEKNEYTFDGFEEGLSDLEKKIKSAVPNITEAVTSAIEGVKRFVTGGSLDSILQMGTDIITGICQGIINSKEDLTTAISEGIRKICDWIHDNKDQVKEAGLVILQAIGDGIKENRTEIATACDDIYDIINSWTETHKEDMTNLGMTLGGPFIEGFAKGVQQEIQATIRGMWDSIVADVKTWPQKIKEGFSNLSFTDLLKNVSIGAFPGGQNIGMQIVNGIMDGLGIPNIVDIIGNVVRKIIDWFKEKLGIHSPSRVMADEVGQYVILGVAQGILDHIGDFFTKVGELKDKVVNFFKDLFGFGKDEENPINNLDASKAKELDKVLQSLNKTAQTCKTNLSTAFKGLNDSLRTSFVSCANIARNQFTNISNIVKNQSSNARNAATSQFISLKKVISTQLSEARQIVTSKMISISKVVNTQSSNARNNATRHFISLRKVIQTQMSEAYSSVSSYMNKIAHATNRTLSTKVNVTKSVKTVDAGKSSALAALSASAFNSLNAMALSGSGLTYATATGGSSGIGLSGANNSSANQAMYFELPTYLDGKVVAKTTAKYMNNELTILDKKNSRKRGNK